MHRLHVRPEQELRNNLAKYEEFHHNRYLMEKIKEAEDDTDTRLRTHDEVWQALGRNYQTEL